MGDNIILIGMPGAGKSTIGVILAKVLGYQFVDTDLVIQERENRKLKDIIKEDGLEGFIEIEDKVNQSVNPNKTVISPGGSVIYGQGAMEHFGQIGVIVYIKLSYETLKSRLGNIKQRGVVLKEGQDLLGLYEERCPLYEKYAHIIIDAENKDVETLMEEVVFRVEEYWKHNKKRINSHEFD